MVLAVAALIGVITALVYYWDDLNAALGDFSGILWVILGPIGMLVGLIDAIDFSSWTEGFKSFLNFFRKGINEMIRKINSIPMLGKAMGFKEMPMLAQGATNFTGTAVVGEAGPEIVTTKNTNVVSNENILRLMKSTESIVKTSSSTGPGGDQATTNMLLQQLVTALTSPTGAPSAAAAGPGGKQDILLVMDPAGTKVIARAVGAQLNKTHNVFAKRS